MIVLGITGHPAAGKDTFADYLVDTKDFKKYALSDQLREEMTALGLPLDRPSMNKFSIEQKQKFGNDYLCKLVIKKMNGNTAIPSVRSAEEVNTFRKELGEQFKLITIDASIENRYARAVERSREGDNITFESFREQEEKEKNNPNGAHTVDKVIEMADIIVPNNGTKDDLYKLIEKLLLTL